MENRYIQFFKNLFFTFNLEFLSSRLEKRFRSHKSLEQIFFFFRKKIIFCLLSFSCVCILLAQISPAMQKAGLLISTSGAWSWSVIAQLSLIFIPFIIFLCLNQFLKSSLLRDVDFFISRSQIACRALMKSSAHFDYTSLHTTHLLKFSFAFFSLAPLIILYNGLFSYFKLWILLPLCTNLIVLGIIGFLKHKSESLFQQAQNTHKSNIDFFCRIENSIETIRTLAFEFLFKKKALAYPVKSSGEYQKIFENSIIIYALKCVSFLLIFSLNSVLFLSLHQTRAFSEFAPILALSFLVSYAFLSFLKIFEYHSGAKQVVEFFKNIDTKISQSHAVAQNENKLQGQIKEHCLTAVIGSTAEERSSYLSVYFENLEHDSENTQTKKQAEFLSRHSLILEGSIRENIVQSKDFDAHYYREVLSACAVSREIDLLPDNDLTFLNPNNQKFTKSFLRKIAIARIVYAKADMNFFDDPFCGLAQNESGQIFLEAFQKLLAGTTRVFCTDQIEFAALSDNIILFKSGRIVEQNSHLTLIAYDSLYARLFYAGSENKRFEILQNHTKYNQTEPASPFSDRHMSTHAHQENQKKSPAKMNILETIKARMHLFTYFGKVFFPVFASKEFYGFVTFLTISVWSALYSVHLIFQNMHLSIPTKTALLFTAFNVIAIVAFSVMLVFYKKVYEIFSFIVENISKLYFSNISSHDNMSSHGLTAESTFDWKNKNTLSVTTDFCTSLLHFLISGFVLLGFGVLLSVLNFSIVISIAVAVVIIALFVRPAFDDRFFFDDASSKQLNEKFKAITLSFFDSFRETKSKNVTSYMLEKIHAKLYALYLFEHSQPKTNRSFLRIIGFQPLLENYHILETIALSTKSDRYESQKKSLEKSWPINGIISFKSVKFVDALETPSTFSIPFGTRFVYPESADIKKSAFIDKLRGLSSLVEGEILIDDENISSLNQNDLCNRIAIVSQTGFLPFLSIREHIDPSSKYDDDEVWSVLNIVGLAQRVVPCKNGLLTLMEELPQEMHWSGEIVLFSFARAILNQNKIICVDCIETSETVENKICNLISTKLSNCTVVFAAHQEKFKNLCTMNFNTISKFDGMFLTTPDTIQSQLYLQD